MIKKIICFLIATVTIFSCFSGCAVTHNIQVASAEPIVENIEDSKVMDAEPVIEEPKIVIEEVAVPTEPEITLEEFLNNIEDKSTRNFYERLYEMYDFEQFNARSEIPQYFQTVYTDKFSVGTIRSAGCGISSLAMISSYLFDEEITPPMMLKYDRGDNPAAALEAGIRGLKLNCTTYRGQAALDNLDEALEAGHPLIANVRKASIFTEAGHFIVIAGKTEDGKYIVNDPNLENYYNPRMVDGFMNGFTRKEITTGLAGIYIFDTKNDFVDMRNVEDVNA